MKMKDVLGVKAMKHDSSKGTMGYGEERAPKGTVTERTWISLLLTDHMAYRTYLISGQQYTPGNRMDWSGRETLKMSMFVAYCILEQAHALRRTEVKQQYS